MNDKNAHGAWHMVQDELPICFTRKEALLQWRVTATALDSRIKRALKRNEFLLLKNGLYVTSGAYLHELDKVGVAEFFASQIYQPSYISLEYALEKHGLLLRSPCSVYGAYGAPITSITTGASRVFKNFAGKFSYSNIKPLLFFGFEEVSFRDERYRVATKAKALFDFLYLRRDLHRRNARRLKKQLLEELGLQWSRFSEKDFDEFDRYVWKSDSKKMMDIWRIIRRRFDAEKMNCKFAAWRKGLLS